MRIPIGKVCVYTHSINGRVFYVGKGVSSRPFETSRRGEKWHLIVSKSEHFDAEIVAWFDSDQEARLREAQEIAKYKPEANLMGNGWHRSEEFKKANSRLHGGKTVAPETRMKISQGRMGIEPWNKGRKTSDEQKRKLSLAQRGKRAVIETSTGALYPSAREICRVFQIPKTTLLQHLNGKLKHAKGRIFQCANILAAGQAVTARGGRVRPKQGRPRTGISPRSANHPEALQTVSGIPAL